MPRGTEIPSRGVSPANRYSNQHHPHPRKIYKEIEIRDRTTSKFIEKH